MKVDPLAKWDVIVPGQHELAFTVVERSQRRHRFHGGGRAIVSGRHWNLGSGEQDNE